MPGKRPSGLNLYLKLSRLAIRPWFFCLPAIFFTAMLLGMNGGATRGGLISLIIPAVYATDSTALVCSCGVDTSNTENDDNDNGANDDNDNASGDDHTDNADNIASSGAICTCADGTSGFWRLPSGGQPAVPGTSTVPQSVREIHGE